MVPVTVNNAWKMNRWGNFPLGVGVKITLTIHDPFPIKDMLFSEVFERAEKEIVNGIVLEE